MKLTQTFILNDNIKKLKICHNRFQHADFDNDLVGMFIELLIWLREMKIISQDIGITFDKVESPETWVKIHPHYPSNNIRENIRCALGEIFKIPINTPDEEVLFVSYYAIFVCAFYYNLSPFKLEELMYSDEKVTRESVLQILIEYGMPPHFNKEPSMVDYTHLYS